MARIARNVTDPGTIEEKLIWFHLKKYGTSWITRGPYLNKPKVKENATNILECYSLTKVPKESVEYPAPVAKIVKYTVERAKTLLKTYKWSAHFNKSQAMALHVVQKTGEYKGVKMTINEYLEKNVNSPKEKFNVEMEFNKLILTKILVK